MTYLKQSGSLIPDAWSAKFTFSLIVTLHLTKTENRTKKSDAAPILRKKLKDL